MILTSTHMIRQTIYERLEQDGCICVFPTETSAKFWADDYVYRSARGALLLEKVMAWDRFKALFLPVKEQQPTNTIIRTLFAINFLQDTNQSSALQWFTYPQFPESSENLSGSVARLLPRLDELERMRLERPEAFHRLPSSYRNDVALIDRAYRKFLEEHDFFEPQFLHPHVDYMRVEAAQNRYAIFFPEVCAGWKEFSAMQNLPTWIEIYMLDVSEQRTRLAWYPNEIMELKAQLDAIEHLLQQNVRIEDIAITIGDSKRWTPHLLRQAALREIPLTIIEGMSPLSYTPGRFLQALQDIYTHRFSLNSMKSLLLDPRFPCKDKALLRRLIERAIDFSIEMGSLEPHQDMWYEKLSCSTQAEDTRLLEWYIAFKQRIINLARASTVDALIKALFAIQEFLLEKDAFTGKEATQTKLRDARVYAYCIDFLTQIQRNVESCGLKNTPRLYALYLRFLEKQRYIPQERAFGIPVYTYTVSVALPVSYHFLLGCTEDITQIKVDALPLIPESVWKDDEEDTSTAQFLDHYRLCAEHISWSAAQAAFDGTTSLAPAWFIDHDAVETSQYIPSGSMYTELLAWNQNKHLQWRPRMFQTQWFSRACRTAYLPPRIDFAEPKPSVSLWSRFADSDGLLHVSSTMLDAFMDCPMKWVSRYLFSLEKGSYEVEKIDHKQIGIMLHSILENFFREVTQLTHSYRGDLEQQYTEILLTLCAREFAKFAATPKAPGKTTLHYIQERYTKELLAIVGAEAKQFDDYVSEAFEQKLTFSYPTGSYVLEGRIDRILSCTHDDGSKTVAVVDYKKTISTRKRDYDDFSEAIPSHQMPVYAKLIQDTSLHTEAPRVVGVAAFYNIGKGSYRIIWKEGEEEKREQMIALVEKNLALMVEALHEGRLGTTVANEPCSRCDYRQICRRRYTLV